MEQLADVLITTIQYGIGPAFILLVGYLLNRKQEKRTETVKEALDVETTKVRQAVEEHSVSSSVDSTMVVEAVKYLRDDLRDFRAEFKDYRKDHAREHNLINDKLLH